MLFSIVHFGVNTPYWDQWDMVKLLQQSDTHAVPLHGLWMQHNEHRLFFPLIVLLASARLTNWNTNAELIISFLFAIVSISILYLMTQNKFKHKLLAFMWVLLLSCWFFSPVQWENWLWGWQLSWFMSIASTLATFFLLVSMSKTSENRSKIYFAASILTAVIATFSLGSGMLIWIVGLGLLLSQRRALQALITWSAAGILSTFTYYYHYVQPSNSPPILTFAHQPLNFARYVLAYIGRPVTADLNTSLLIGGILLSLLVPLCYYVWRLKDARSNFTPWILLIVFALATCVVTAVSRVGYGYSQSMSSRYTAISILYIIGITGLFLAIADVLVKKRQSVAPVIVVLFSITLPLLFSSYTNGYRGLELRSQYLKQIATCTAGPHPPNACLAQTFPDPGEARSMLTYLKKNHLAGY